MSQENVVAQKEQSSANSSFGESESLGGVSAAAPAFQLFASDAKPIQRQETEQEDKHDPVKDSPDWSKPKRVMVIGSPSPAELNGRPYQFIDAAKYQGVDENTVWVIEKTGYDLGEVDMSYITSAIGPGHIIWLTPGSDLVTTLNGLPEKSISEFRVYSHGLPGQLTLRYGWADQGSPNYGLSVSEVSAMKGQKFSDDAKIEFNSCNTGSDTEDGNVAEEFASQTGKDVDAWTGRTSYTEVNNGAADGDTDIHASRKDRGGGRLTGGYDMTEVYSQDVMGRVPKLTTFSGDKGFKSTIDISARLPQSRDFYVAKNGSVTVSFPDARFVGPERETTEKDALTVILHQNINWGIDSNAGEKIVYPSKDGKASFSGLKSGDYYLEIINRNAPQNHGERFVSNLTVSVN